MRLRVGTLQTSMQVFLAEITVVRLKLFLRRMFPSLGQCLVVFFLVRDGNFTEDEPFAFCGTGKFSTAKKD